MRALGLLLALAAALLPAPALADVTARYSAGSSTITIEADDGGDWRLGVAGKTPLTLIRHDGVPYLVLTDAAGKVTVTRVDGVLAVAIAKMGALPGAQLFILEAGGTDSVAGYPGAAWQFGPKDEPPVEVLMSSDPALAPIGDVFRELAGMGADGLAPLLKAGANVTDQLRALVAKGTPLRIRPVDSGGDPVLLELVSVSTDPIDPARFVLPGPVISAEEFFDTLRRDGMGDPPN